MTYSAGESALLTQVQAVSGFSASNTSRGNFGILNSGAAAVYAVLIPGPFRMEWDSPARAHWYWDTAVRVYQQYVDDGTTLTNLEASAQGIINRVLQYPRLGLGMDQDTVIDASPMEGEETTEIWNKDGGISWLKLTLHVSWHEWQAVTAASGEA